jgi:DNA-binding NarL/FixJ family response regulator
MLLGALLIEDSRVFRDSLIPSLHIMAGAKVMAVAETAPEAMAALDGLSDRWQLSIVDLFLREGSGLDVLRALQRRSAHQRVAVLTNHATLEMRERARALGADAVFDKSTELDGFFEWCRQLRMSHLASGALDRTQGTRLALGSLSRRRGVPADACEPVHADRRC